MELKGDVLRLLTEFHGNGKLPIGLNCTIIVLSTKVESPQRLNNFWLTYLVECLYKILAEVLANIFGGLFKVLHISLSQFLLKIGR